MTDQKQDDTAKQGATKSKFQSDFEALPLEEKFANLFKMEAVTLSETFSYVLNSPLKAVEKVGDAVIEFGTKIETEVRKAARASSTTCPPETGPSAPQPKARSAKKTTGSKKP